MKYLKMAHYGDHSIYRQEQGNLPVAPYVAITYQQPEQKSRPVRWYNTGAASAVTLHPVQKTSEGLVVESYHPDDKNSHQDATLVAVFVWKTQP